MWLEFSLSTPALSTILFSCHNKVGETETTFFRFVNDSSKICDVAFSGQEGQCKESHIFHKVPFQGKGLIPKKDPSGLCNSASK